MLSNRQLVRPLVHAALPDLDHHISLGRILPEANRVQAETVEKRAHGDKVPVGLKYELNILKIDDFNHEVHVDFTAFVHYELPGDESCDEADAGSAQSYEALPCHRPEWVPHFYVYDARSELRVVEETFWKHGRLRFAMLNYLVNVQTTFELHRFPFDRQILEFNFNSPNSFLHAYQAAAAAVGPSMLDDSPNCGMEVVLDAEGQLWSLHDATARASDELVQNAVFVERFPWYYLANIGGFLFCLVIASFITVISSKDSLMDRFSISITLMLAVIALKFVMAGMVPRTNYMTILDWYVLFSMMVLLSVILKDFIIGILFQRKNENVTDIDYYATAMISGSWVLVNVTIVSLARFKAFCASWDHVERSQHEQSRKDAPVQWEEGED